MVDIIFIILGGAFLYKGIRYRLGYETAGSWIIPFSYYRTAIYGSILLGISLLFLAIAGFVLDTPWIIPVRILIGIFFFTGLFMWLFEPRFAKPDWINWLEDNHYEIIQELRYEVLRMDVRNWDQKIKTQADLELWVEEVRHKNRL